MPAILIGSTATAPPDWHGPTDQGGSALGFYQSNFPTATDTFANSMLLYEVNLSVDGSEAARYSSWLREHVRTMLEFDGFEAAAWYVRSPGGDSVPEPDEPAGRRTWTIHYQVRDRSALQSYFDEHADEMREEAAQRFGDHVTAERRILEQKRLFQGRRMEDTGPA